MRTCILLFLILVGFCDKIIYQSSDKSLLLLISSHDCQKCIYPINSVLNELAKYKDSTILKIVTDSKVIKKKLVEENYKYFIYVDHNLADSFCKDGYSRMLLMQDQKILNCIKIKDLEKGNLLKLYNSLALIPIENQITLKDDIYEIHVYYPASTASNYFFNL